MLTRLLGLRFIKGKRSLREPGVRRQHVRCPTAVEIAVENLEERLLLSGNSPLGSVSLSAQNGSIIYGPGGSTTYTFTVNRASGVTGAFDIDLSVSSALPAGATDFFTVGGTTVTQLHFGTSDNSLSAVLHVSTATKSMANTYLLTARAEVDDGGPTGDFQTANSFLAISPRPLTISITAANKVYDGTTSATLTSQTLSGVLAGDDVNVVGGTANFGTKSVGNGKTVTLSGVTLTGADATNYILNPATTTANVTPLALTLVAEPKVKNQGQTDPSLTVKVTSGALLPGDSFSGELTRASGETVGVYGITQNTLTAGSNYTIHFTGSTEIILAANLNLTGAWRTSGQLTSVVQNGGSMSFVDLGGVTSTGTFTSPTAITGRTGLTATIDTDASDDGRIVWSDGTIWLRVSLGGQYFNPSNGNLTEVRQNGTQLKFTNAAGTTINGTLTGVNTVSLPDWGQTGTFDDGVLTMSGGTTWKKLDLSPNYTANNGSAAVGVIENGTTTLVFFNRTGETTTGHWVNPNTVTADNWNVTGTVSNGQISWSNGSVWQKKLVISGTTNAGGDISITQTGGQIILTNRTGQTSRAQLTSSNTIVALDWGTISGTIDDGKITWSNGTMWKGIDFNDLDAVFSDVSNFPFGG